MKRDIITTEDGSKTLFINDLNETYHSKHGAIQEANHVFIENGIKNIYQYEINILELGFGTGLNVLVTINELLKNDKNHIINYYGVEKYPINEEEIKILDYYNGFENPEIEKIFEKIHLAPWETLTEIVPNFNLKKIKADFFDIRTLDLPPITLVYFDCFGSHAQPDLWEKPLFDIVSEKMSNNSLLTTYSAKGSVKRILQNLNFEVKKVPGPKGKREMINAWKKQ